MEEFIKRILTSQPIIRNHQAQSDPPTETTALKKPNPADDVRFALPSPTAPGNQKPNEVLINDSVEKEHVSSDISHFITETEQLSSGKEDLTSPDNIITFVDQSPEEVEEENYNPFGSLLKSFKDDSNEEKAPSTYSDFEKMLEKAGEESDFLS